MKREGYGFGIRSILIPEYLGPCMIKVKAFVCLWMVLILSTVEFKALYKDVAGGFPCRAR